MNILNCYFRNYIEDEIKKVTAEEVEQFVTQQLEGVFIFATIWSVCCTCDSAGRDRMNETLRMLIEKNKMETRIPSGAPMYDFVYSTKQLKFHPW